MIILAIETSCDDTCVAIVKASGKRRPHFEILSNIISSQVEIHKKWGGVYPSLAKREHQKNLPLVLKKALKPLTSDVNIRCQRQKKIDAIAVTVGPGLEPCLWVGLNFAKDLAQKWNTPLISVNHIEAHILANFISPTCHSERSEESRGQCTNNGTLRSAQGDPPPLLEQKWWGVNFPVVCLVVSGGHTQLILMRDFGHYKILGETRDDAAGECFDKIARLLGLAFPGGPAIAAEAKKYVRGKKPTIVGFLPRGLPRPMIYQKNYDFSFSGLKTAVLYNFRSQSPGVRKSKKYIQEMCTEVQQAIIDVLIHKTIKAAKDYRVQTVILGGGVAANKELRKQFQQRLKKEKSSFKFHVPSFKFCTDNAAMVGVAGYFQWLKGKKRNWKDIEVNANLRV